MTRLALAATFHLIVVSPEPITTSKKNTLDQYDQTGTHSTTIVRLALMLTAQTMPELSAATMICATSDPLS